MKLVFFKLDKRHLRVASEGGEEEADPGRAHRDGEDLVGEDKVHQTEHSLQLLVLPALAQLDMFHSEILASVNFNKDKIWSPGLENNQTLKCCSCNFPTYSYILRLLEKYQINI